MIENYDRHLILAVDPGGVTGWAKFEPATGQFNQGEVDGGALGFGPWFATVITQTPNVLWEVVCEKFTIGEMTKGKTTQYDAVYLNGFLEIYCHIQGVQFTRHTVSNVKSFATNDKLKKLGWYTPSKGGHQNDAARHMLAYVAKKPWAQPILGELLT